MTDYDNKIDLGAENISVIIFTANAGLRTTLRDAVKNMGVAAPEMIDSQEGCLSALSEHPASWMLMDTSFGLEVTASVLAAARNAEKSTVRPIYLVLSEAETNLLYLALEYGVFKVRPGNVSPVIASEDLHFMLETVAVEQPVMQTMIEIRELWAKSDWNGAAQLIEAAANLNNNHVRLKIAFVDTLILSGDLEGARSVAASLRDLFPSNLRVTHTLARVLMKQKNFQAAADILVKAEKISNLNPDRLVALGECFLEMGSYKEARQKFDQALNLAPDSVSAKSGLVKSDLLMGNMEQALQMAREIGSPVDLAKVLNTAAVIATRSGQVDRAKQMYAQGIVLLDAESTLAARVWFNLGLLHYRTKALEQAVRCFEEACKLDAGFAAASHNRDLLLAQVRGSASRDALDPSKSKGHAIQQFNQQSHEESETKGPLAGVDEGAGEVVEMDQIIDNMQDDDSI
jgi:tetratricopeptide (TPR) repeat protein